MLDASRAHLAECREGYFTHLSAAVRIAATLLTAALACFIHAFVPGLFVRSASSRVERVRSGILARQGSIADALPAEASCEEIDYPRTIYRERNQAFSALLDAQAIFLDPPVSSVPPRRMVQAV